MMKKFAIEGVFDIAEFMYEKITDGASDVMFVGYYEDATRVLKELISYDDTVINQLELEPEECDGYEKEYYVTIDSDLHIWCEKAYYDKKNIYLYTESDCVLIADDCNFDILERVGCDDIYKVSYIQDFDEDEFDMNTESDYKPEDPCNCDCMCCGLNCMPEEEYCEQSKTKTVPESSTITSRVVVDNTGKIKGFEKSWSSQSENMTYYTTYSHYGTDQKMIKKLMENFDIKI